MKKVIQGCSVFVFLICTGAVGAQPILPRGEALDGQHMGRQSIDRQKLFEMGGDYFLSATNPAATVDQRDTEDLAMQMLQSPQVVKAKQLAAAKWKTMVGRKNISAEAMTRFDELMDEWAFWYCMRAANSDPFYPKATGPGYQPAHEWFGRKVPGTRASLGDNPDSHYTYVPIDVYSNYEIIGKRSVLPTEEFSFTLLGPITTTLGFLDGKDVQYEADGTFVIHIGPEPANGRPNYIQTQLDVDHLLVRDSRSDWRQVPNAYRVRLLDTPRQPPMTFEQFANRAARYMVEEVPFGYWFLSIYNDTRFNEIGPTLGMGNHGGLVTQKLNWTRLELADDEAFVINIGDGGAIYRTIVLHDFWFRTLDYWKHTSNLSSGQSAANEDGTYTYVISIEDPGVHNWLDPMGLHELLVLHRWQGLPENGEPWVNGERVKFQDLHNVLPAGVKRVTAKERQQQLAERRRQFDLRWVDK